MVVGRLMNSTILENWYNNMTDELVDINVDENLYPNAKFWDFCFVPSSHRFAIFLKHNASVSQVEKFFVEAFNKVVDNTPVDEVYVNVVTTDDSID